MANVCIPKLQATKLINTLKEGGLEKISNMTSQERREFFAKSVGVEMGQKVNGAFEKALASKRKTAMLEFAQKITGQDKRAKQSIIDRIKKLDDGEFLNENILEDYVSETLGARITQKEVAQIKEISKKVSESSASVEKEFSKVLSSGKITKEYEKALIENAKALQESDMFLLERSKTSWSETLWNHMKASMLLNPASWTVNVLSNLQMSVISGIERRVGTTKLSGYSGDLAKDWKRVMTNVRKETGYDMSRALSIDEMLDKQIMGEQTAIGKDTAFTKFVYETALGTNDAWSARMAFADGLDLHSASMAESMGLKGEAAKSKAREIFIDATQIVPKTEEGKIARQAAVLEAQTATWTQKGALSSFTLKLKQNLNKFAEEDLGLKGFKIGDLLEPFVKTPANIQAYGIDAAGLGLIRGAGKMGALIKNSGKLTDVQKKRLLGESLRDMMRTGFGLGGGALAASFIPAENFVGAYDPNRYKYEELRGSNNNSIRIGDKWYSLDYFGGLATPMVAALYAKKYGDGNVAKMITQYLIGVADQSTNIPFVGSVKELGMSGLTKLDSESSIEDIGKIAYEWLTSQVTSRVPGVMVNISKLFDDNEREFSGLKEGIQAKVPEWRNSLKVKQDMLGQNVETEIGRNENGVDKYLAIVTQILAGARVKTSKKEPYAEEIIRLKDTGNGPSLTSWKYRLGKRQQALKDKVGEEEYRRIFKEEFGKPIIEKMNALMKSKEYQNLSDAEKKVVIDNINDNVIEKIYVKNKIPLREVSKDKKNQGIIDKLSK